MSIFKTLDFSVGVANVSARAAGPVKGRDLLSPLRGGGGGVPNTLALVAQRDNPIFLIVWVALDAATHASRGAEDLQLAHDGQGIGTAL